MTNRFDQTFSASLSLSDIQRLHDLQGIINEDDTFMPHTEVRETISRIEAKAVTALGNPRRVCCNECHTLLTGEELSVYPLAWQHSGDMYCMTDRVCPDDCRKTPCPALARLFARIPEPDPDPLYAENYRCTYGIYEREDGSLSEQAVSYTDSWRKAQKAYADLYEEGRRVSLKREYHDGTPFLPVNERTVFPYECFEWYPFRAFCGEPPRLTLEDLRERLQEEPTPPEGMTDGHYTVLTETPTTILERSFADWPTTVGLFLGRYAIDGGDEANFTICVTYYNTNTLRREPPRDIITLRDGREYQDDRS